MRLSVGERLNLLQVLPEPEKAHIVVYRALDEARRELGFKPEEIERYGIRVVAACMEHKQDVLLPGGRLDFGKCDICGAPLVARAYRWDVAKDEPTEIALPPSVVDIIAAELRRIEEKGELTRWLIPLYEKFVESGGEK